MICLSNDINKMDLKQLRNEVQLLRDELAIFKRKYEDIIYNLDDDNLSSRLVREKDNMKTAIEINAEGIKAKVSKEDLEEYSTIEQTAKSIQSVVSKSAKLDEAIVIESIDKATNTEAIYVIQEKDEDGNVISETYYYFNDITKQWEVLSGDSIYTVFNQTAEGFALKGNVLIDGNAVVTKNLELSGVVKWNMDNSPVLTQYSSDCVNWHSPMVDGDMYMQMSFDGGKEWSTPTKVVGTDGKNGTNGSNASVTFTAVNNALGKLFKTWSGATPTTITNSYIYSPSVKGGAFYGSVFYAGSGLGYSQMDENGFSVYDDTGAAKVGIGYYSGDMNYPYVSLGIGAGYSGNGIGSICKLGNGIWIGDSSVIQYGGDYPGGGSGSIINISSFCPYATGIFIDFSTDKVYKFLKGVYTEM